MKRTYNYKCSFCFSNSLLFIISCCCWASTAKVWFKEIEGFIIFSWGFLSFIFWSDKGILFWLFSVILILVSGVCWLFVSCFVSGIWIGLDILLKFWLFNFGWFINKGCWYFYRHCRRRRLSYPRGRTAKNQKNPRCHDAKLG